MEVEDVSLLILDGDCICGSKGLFAMDAAKNGACTLTLLVR